MFTVAAFQSAEVEEVRIIRVQHSTVHRTQYRQIVHYSRGLQYTILTVHQRHQ